MESFGNGQENMVSAGTPNRRLRYTESFKNVIATHSGLISEFLTFANKVKRDKVERGKVGESNLTFESDGVKITVIEDSHKANDQLGIFFKVDVGGEKYFVKSVPPFGDQEGTGEMTSLRKAKKILQGLKGVEVVDFKLGYYDKDRAYFVSKWQDGVNLKTYLKNSDHRYSQATIDDLKLRLKEIQGRLSGFNDVEDYNILYDASADKLIVFDVFERDIWAD